MYPKHRYQIESKSIMSDPAASEGFPPPELEPPAYRHLFTLESLATTYGVHRMGQVLGRILAHGLPAHEEGDDTVEFAGDPEAPVVVLMLPTEDSHEATPLPEHPAVLVDAGGMARYVGMELLTNAIHHGMVAVDETVWLEVGLTTANRLLLRTGDNRPGFGPRQQQHSGGRPQHEGGHGFTGLMEIGSAGYQRDDKGGKSVWIELSDAA